MQAVDASAILCERVSPNQLALYGASMHAQLVSAASNFSNELMLCLMVSASSVSQQQPPGCERPVLARDSDATRGFRGSSLNEYIFVSVTHCLLSLCAPAATQEVQPGVQQLQQHS
jgi:hypothetical protein